MLKPSIFMDKAIQPQLSDVEQLLPESYPYREDLLVCI